MLNSDVTKLECNGTIIRITGPGMHSNVDFIFLICTLCVNIASQTATTAVATVIDISVIILSSVSILFTIAALVKSYKLAKVHVGNFILCNTH